MTLEFWGFRQHSEAGNKSLIHLGLLHPPTLLLSRVSVQSPIRDKSEDVWINGNAADVAETHW